MENPSLQPMQLEVPYQNAEIKNNAPHVPKIHQIQQISQQQQFNFSPRSPSLNLVNDYGLINNKQLSQMSYTNRNSSNPPKSVRDDVGSSNRSRGSQRSKKRHKVGGSQSKHASHQKNMEQSHRTAGSRTNRGKNLQAHYGADANILHNLTTDQNIISSFDKIEEARFEMADFKKHLNSMIDYFYEISQ